MASPIKPQLPYLLFHPKFIAKHRGQKWQTEMYRQVYQLGWFRESCFAIDVDCRRFPLLDVVSHGRAWTIWNILAGGAILKVEYVFGEPVQLSFDEARDTYVEFVCKHRWWTASHETERQFRERNARYSDFRALMEPLSLAGRWPVSKKVTGKN